MWALLVAYLAGCATMQLTDYLLTKYTGDKD